MNFSYKTYFDIALLVDRSTSTSEQNKTLNENVKSVIDYFIRNKRDDVITSLALIQFNENCEEEDVLIDFESLEELNSNDFSIASDGATNHATAINRALDSLLKREADFESQGHQSIASIVVLITDGYPDAGSPDGYSWDKDAQREVIRQFNAAGRRIKTLEQADKINFFVYPIKIGTRMEKNDVLNRLTSFSEHIVPSSTSFHDFFEKTIYKVYESANVIQNPKIKPDINLNDFIF